MHLIQHIDDVGNICVKLQTRNVSLSM